MQVKAETSRHGGVKADKYSHFHPREGKQSFKTYGNIKRQMIKSVIGCVMGHDIKLIKQCEKTCKKCEG